ncbi:nucleotidyltransferase domain-containing protein [Candidatus Pacearchaeota archaeon]|nr:nucleotidyltransferase domain-containing protein [Candidatus Pacearchaeota archaeon]
MKRKYIKRNIREYFFVNTSAKLRVREIERTLALSLPSVIHYCRELENEGILTVIRIGKVVFYTANKSNEKYLLEKRIYNLRRVYDSGLVSYLKQELNNPSLILFGSFAKGEDNEESDIDLYIETPSKKRVSLEKFEKLLKRTIHVFQHKSLRELRNPHLANNIINGIPLNKQIEVFT